jgi:tetratricopeptide (TPR) repeat protein
MMLFTTTFLALALFGGATATGPMGGPGSDPTFDPVAVLRELEEQRERRVRAAFDAQRSSDIAAIDADISEQAQKKLEGVSAAAIEAADAVRWAPLFSKAQRHEDARSLLTRFLATSPDPAPRFRAQLAHARASTDLNDGAAIYEQLLQMTPPTRREAISLGSIAAGTFHFWIRNAHGAEGALEAMEYVMRFVPAAPFESDQERKDAGWAQRQIADARALYLMELGRSDEAIQVLDHALATLDKDIFRIDGLEAARRRYTTVGVMAPPVRAVQTHGAFAGLESYRGKVVLLEFTAHWCHACHKALPSVKQMYADLKDQGLEVVSVTTYYGFFGAEKDIPREKEYEMMKGKLAEQGVTWPMVYVERDTLADFGVSGIPQHVLLDREGRIQAIDLGFSYEKFGRLRSRAEELLAK